MSHKNSEAAARPEGLNRQRKISFAPPFIDPETIDEVVETLQSGWITTGPKVKELEDECRKLSRSPYCICVNSWTSGAQLVLKWWGLQPGDEVIIPAYTYAATALAVMHAGGKPIMVDIREDLTMDPQALKKAITNKTKAIIPVDIGGWPCDYSSITEVVNDPEIISLFAPSNPIQTSLGRLLLISDAAHSIGARYRHLPSARQCDLTIYSLHAVKNITTAEGGVICLNLPEYFDDEEVYHWMKLNTLNGQTKDALKKSQAGEWRYDIVTDGLKINMPDLCAAVGLSQIRQYESFLLPLRRRIFDRYTRQFASCSWAYLPEREDALRSSSCHLYPLRIKGISEDQRDEIIKMISSNGVAVNVHFIPLPMLSLFKGMGYDINHFPVTYDQYSREISLPIYPQLSLEDTDYVAQTVIEAYEHVVANTRSTIHETVS